MDYNEYYIHGVGEGSLGGLEGGATADKNTLVGEAINIMNTKKITSLFVCEKKAPIGIVHIHDLLRIST